jgi:hypothetical protein
MRLYNRRFAQIARRRRRINALGRTNAGNRCLIPGFSLNRGDMKRLFTPLRQWIWLEMTEGWRSWGAKEEEKAIGAKAAATPSMASETLPAS